MDLALVYNPDIAAFDVAVQAHDLVGDDTLASAVLVSLLCDRQAQPYEVPAGQDPRGWWADAYGLQWHATGSRLWLLEREKQLPGVLLRCKQYVEECLAWCLDDGLATAVNVAVFTPRVGWLVAVVGFMLNGVARNFRFEFDQEQQRWRLGQEAF